MLRDGGARFVALKSIVQEVDRSKKVQEQVTD